MQECEYSTRLEKGIYLKLFIFCIFPFMSMLKFLLKELLLLHSSISIIQRIFKFISIVWSFIPLELFPLKLCENVLSTHLLSGRSLSTLFPAESNQIYLFSDNSISSWLHPTLPVWESLYGMQSKRMNSLQNTAERFALIRCIVCTYKELEQ